MVEIYSGTAAYKVSSALTIGRLGRCLDEYALQNQDIDPTHIQLEYQDSLARTADMISDQFHWLNKRRQEKPYTIDSANTFDDSRLASLARVSKLEKIYTKPIVRFKIRKDRIGQSVIGGNGNIDPVSAGLSNSEKFERINVTHHKLGIVAPFSLLTNVSKSFGVGYTKSKQFLNFSASFPNMNLNFYSGENVGKQVNISTLAGILISMLTVDRAVGSDCLSKVITKDSNDFISYPLEQSTYNGGVCLHERLVNKSFRATFKTIPSNNTWSDSVLGKGECGVNEQFNPLTVSVEFKPNQQCFSIGYSKAQMAKVKQVFRDIFKEEVTAWRVTAFDRQGYNLGCQYFPAEEIEGF